MSVKVSGMKELFDTLDKMDKKGENIGNKALKEAANHVKSIEQQVAQSTHNTYSENVGWKEIKKYPIRRRKGSKYISIGIREGLTSSVKKKDEENVKNGVQRPTYWDRVKGLLNSPFI